MTVAVLIVAVEAGRRAFESSLACAGLLRIIKTGTVVQVFNAALYREWSFWHLSQLDQRHCQRRQRVEARFLLAIGITDVEAILQYDLASRHAASSKPLPNIVSDA